MTVSNITILCKNRQHSFGNCCFPDVEVNIEQDDYSVPENKGTLEVCITLSNPTDRDVIITGSTTPLPTVEAQGTPFLNIIYHSFTINVRKRN